MKKYLLTIFTLTFLTLSYAGGYRVALQGSRMLGLAHAGTSVFGSAENVFFNPAGLMFGEGNKFAFGVSFIKSNVKFQNADYLWTAQTQNPISTPFYLYLSLPANEYITFSVGVYTPFGSSVKWEQDWVGSHLVNNISLKAIYIQPGFSFKMNDYLAFSAGLIIGKGSVEYNKNINRFLTGDNGERTDITLTDKNITAAGYNVSMAIRASDRFSFGINYRSAVVFKSRYGKAEFNDKPSFFIERDNFKAELPMPAEWSLGFSLKPCKKWLVAVDANLTQWSIYKKLDIQFNRLPRNVMPKNWNNTVTLRIGTEYQLNENIALRAGYYNDESPIPYGHFSPETPSLDSHNFTFGLGYQKEKWGFDLAFLYVKGKERNASYNYYSEGLSHPVFYGTYVSNAFVGSFGFNYKF